MSKKKLIAGKTYSKILEMGAQRRWRWYKTISQEEKEEAMMIVEAARKVKQSAFMVERWENPKFKNRMTGENHPMYNRISSEETRAKISEVTRGEKNPNFNNWASRKPYCYLWDEPLREKIRNRYGRVCVLSDMLRSILGSESDLDDFEGHEIFSSRRLAVHHSRGDKMEGCDGNEMALVPLQNRFNVKKFDGLKLENHPFYIVLFLLKDIERKHRNR